MSYPTKYQAIDIILGKFLRNPAIFQHSFMVAKCAEIIAEKSGLNKEKAFSLGLLHDCGYTDSFPWQKDFHGREGYSFLNQKGYSDAARICVTHTFPNKCLTTNNFCQEWLDWSYSIIKDIEYDDYDKLIQLCDMLVVDKIGICTFEERIEDVISRHKIPAEQSEMMYKNCSDLKAHFDAKCGCDIYMLLGVAK